MLQTRSQISLARMQDLRLFSGANSPLPPVLHPAIRGHFMIGQRIFGEAREGFLIQRQGQSQVSDDDRMIGVYCPSPIETKGLEN